MDKATVELIQDFINYRFKNPTLLKQAFVRKSYAQEHPNIHDNEILEFYGDEALDMYVTIRLYKQYKRFDNSQFVSQKTEGELTEIKSKNVDKECLAHCIEIMGLEKYLYLNLSDQKNKAWESMSVKEDLFEAIVGAVAVDSEWDWESITDVCSSMLKLADFKENYIDKLSKLCKKLGYEEPYYLPNINEIIQKQEAAQDSLKYGSSYFFTFDYLTTFKPRKKLTADILGREESCTICIKDIKLNLGYLHAPSFYTAKMLCAQKAYEFLNIKQMKKEVGEPQKDIAVKQLHQLFQKNYIQEPIYEYKEEHDENGNPIWQCSCNLPQLDSLEIAENVSKKEVKKTVAFSVLEKLMTFNCEDSIPRFYIPNFTI